MKVARAKKYEVPGHMPMTDEEREELWRDFLARRDPFLRNTLVVEYMPVVKYIAEMNLEEFIADADEDPEVARVVQQFVDNLRSKIDDMKDKEQKTEEKATKKRVSNKRKSRDSDLTEMYED